MGNKRRRGQEGKAHVRTREREQIFPSLRPCPTPHTPSLSQKSPQRGTARPQGQLPLHCSCPVTRAGARRSFLTAAEIGGFSLSGLDDLCWRPSGAGGGAAEPINFSGQWMAVGTTTTTKNEARCRPLLTAADLESHLVHLRVCPLIFRSEWVAS